VRPINLIPKEERGSHGGIARTGPLMYVILGALAVVLIGVVMLVLTSNKISDHEHEITSLTAQKTQVAAKTTQLTPYVNFEHVAKQRIEAVTGLADGRFDWDRIVNQLAFILPPSAQVISLTASSGGGSEGGVLATESPALNLTGCTTGQDETAAVVTAMKQIDGVTRVGLANSTATGEEEKGKGGGGGSSGESECPSDEYEYELTAAFDEAPTEATTEPAVVETPAPESEEAEGSEETSEGESSGETADSSSGTEGAG
jgi:Tfp pilus assembly protein PilN